MAKKIDITKAKFDLRLQYRKYGGRDCYKYELTYTPPRATMTIVLKDKTYHPNEKLARNALKRAVKRYNLKISRDLGLWDSWHRIDK